MPLVWFPDRVTLGTTRIPILPRAIAASITVSAVARSGWAIAAATLTVSVPGLIDLYVRKGFAPDLAQPLIAVAVMLAVIIVIFIRPSSPWLAAYVVIGAACVYFFLHGVLDMHPELMSQALILINRPAVALVLVGTVGPRPLLAVAWGLAGFLAGGAVTALVCVQDGLPILFGNGPAITLATYSATYLGLSFIQRAQRGRVPDFLRLRHETRKLEAARTLEHRATAILHDTVLNDLALIINGPDTLDDRMRDSMRRDVATLADPDLLEDVDLDEFVDASDASLRNQLTALVSDFQWRGLTVEATGDTGRVVHMSPEVLEAAVGALGACLENILRHSGVHSAEVIVSSTESSVTWTISDAGKGFDPAAVASDRLGLRSSVFRRVELSGGVVKVWSKPGNGTTVLITLPLLAARTRTSAGGTSAGGTSAGGSDA
ncbi:MAG: hypothetical protein QOF79_36 [Actinomycetota bacterium]|jgi:signal transduction histidine kinase|nr:hypothetical protein [Actinomycetota bacterium]